MNTAEKIKINLKDFIEKYNKKYNEIYEKKHPEESELANEFDKLMASSENFKNFVNAFNAERLDCISSDREAAAFMLVLWEETYYKTEKFIPEFEEIAEIITAENFAKESTEDNYYKIEAYDFQKVMTLLSVIKNDVEHLPEGYCRNNAKKYLKIIEETLKKYYNF